MVTEIFQHIKGPAVALLHPFYHAVQGVVGRVVKAPSTLGTFLRSFRWGPRQSTRPREPPVAGPGLTATLN